MATLSLRELFGSWYARQENTGRSRKAAAFVRKAYKKTGGRPTPELERVYKTYIANQRGVATMNRTIAAAALCLSVAGCAGLAEQINAGAARIDPVLQTACNDALMVANLAGLVPGVGAIVPYITAGCATAEGLTKLAADPTSTAWLGQLTGMVKALAARFGQRV